MIAMFTDMVAETQPFEITFKHTTKPEHMPVEIIEVEPTEPLIGLHKRFFETLGQSKYPEREGDNYHPHMTISWKDKRVIDPHVFEDAVHTVEEVCIVEDKEGDSTVLTRARLGTESPV